MISIPHSKKGFTLVEMLLVFALIAIVSAAALSSYFNSSKTFEFLDSYKQVMNSVRVARSYAITNYQIAAAEGQPLESTRYGVEFNEKSVIVFADNGPTPYKFESPQDTLVTFQNVDLSGTEYQLTALSGLTLPMYLYYEAGSGDLSVYEGNDLVDKRCVSFQFDDGNLFKYIVIFRVAGLPEVFNNDPAC
jgi:prepilin-type N-terminal cleavage/methylation domain-containing protein